METYGGFDIVHNNAAAIGFDTVDQMTLEDWIFTTDGELGILYRVCHSVFRHLKACWGSSLILRRWQTSSIWSAIPCMRLIP